jgi:hypothetical protein
MPILPVKSATGTSGREHFDPGDDGGCLRELRLTDDRAVCAAPRSPSLLQFLFREGPRSGDRLKFANLSV